MSEHDALFEAYVNELRAARDRTEAWWNDLQKEELERPNGSNGAPPLRSRWPFGPASHPWVIAVYRKYYLACDELNQRLALATPARRARAVAESDWGRDEDEPEITQVPPRVLLVDRLEREDTRDLYEVVLMLPFVPIGLKGRDLV